MTTALAVTAAALAVVFGAPPTRAGRRMRRLLVHARGQDVRTAPAPSAVWLLAAAAALLVGVALGLWAGVGAAVLAVKVGRRRGPPRAEVDVPLVADLLAACLSAGATVSASLRAAGTASFEAAALCRPVAERLEAGSSPRDAWAEWAQRPDLAAIARACVRAADTGAATTQELRRAGDRARARRRAELAQRAQRAAVWAVLPLGICFLPAFVLVGIVPFALGLLGR